MCAVDSGEVFDRKTADGVCDWPDDEEVGVVCLIVSWGLTVVGDEHSVGIEVPPRYETVEDHDGIDNVGMLHCCYY